MILAYIKFGLPITCAWVGFKTLVSLWASYRCHSNSPPRRITLGFCLFVCPGKCKADNMSVFEFLRTPGFPSPRLLIRRAGRSPRAIVYLTTYQVERMIKFLYYLMYGSVLKLSRVYGLPLPLLSSASEMTTFRYCEIICLTEARRTI